MKRVLINNRIFILLAFFLSMVSSGCKKAELPADSPTNKAMLVEGLEAGKVKGLNPDKQLLNGDLQELQGSAVGPDKALYVTAPLDGTIWRVNPNDGTVSSFTTGLPKRNPDPYFLGAGVIDVAFRGSTAYALVTGVASDLGGEDIVGIYRVDGPNSHTIIADLGTWSVAHPPVPDFFVPTGFQYSIEAFRDGLIVTDGHHNRLLYVTLDGAITEMTALANVVPTGMALRGNTIYFTQAGPIPHLPASAKLMSFSPNSSTVTELASGAGLDVGLFVDVEISQGNNFYALAQGYWDGPWEGAPAEPNTGALLVLKPNGSFEVVVSGLNQPTSMELIGKKAYVVTLTGEIWTIRNYAPPPHGQ